MFASPCSLRSTQCAALIALATAAGILRVEVAEARTSAPRTTKPETNFAAQFILPCSAQTARFQVALDAVAPWFAFFQVAAPVVAECPPEVAAPFTAAGSPTPLPFPTQLRCGPTARQHAYPFAVGPPARGTASSTRADDTSLSADSAARRIAVSRVAVVRLFLYFARPTRPGNPGPLLAGMLSSPSSALRGEPASFRLPSACLAAFGLPSHRSTALPAPTFPSVS